MATSTDVPIYTTTLVSDSASVTIDLTSYQMYTNLKLVISARRGIDNAGGAGTVTFNNDSSSGLYSSTLLYTDGNAPYSYRWSSQNNLPASFSAGDSYYAANTIYIQNYASQSMHKTILSKYGWPGTNSRSATSIGVWRNTSNINTITFSAANNIKAGSTFSVYGIGTASLAKATGGAIYSDEDYWYHVFMNTTIFTPTQNLTADILVVAGGGGGGNFGGGGGGAGGVLAHTSQSLTATSYTVTVGSGGAGGAANSALYGTAGGNSQFGSLTSSVGGGRGGGRATSSPGTTGGSGGGNAYSLGSLAGTSGQGYAGGSGTANGGGGGGGAGEAGNTDAGQGAGGDGTSAYTSWYPVTLFGENISGTYYLAGGGGGWGDNAVGGIGGDGGGGTGAGITSVRRDGLAYTGSGGGATAQTIAGGNGGSGVVIVRYAK